MTHADLLLALAKERIREGFCNDDAKLHVELRDDSVSIAAAERWPFAYRDQYEVLLVDGRVDVQIVDPDRCGACGFSLDIPPSMRLDCDVCREEWEAELREDQIEWSVA